MAPFSTLNQVGSQVSKEVDVVGLVLFVDEHGSHRWVVNYTIIVVFLFYFFLTVFMTK